MPQFTLTCSLCCGITNLWSLSNSEAHVSDMLSMSAVDTDTDRANVTTWETKGAQREDILRAEKER